MHRGREGGREKSVSSIFTSVGPLIELLRRAPSPVHPTSYFVFLTTVFRENASTKTWIDPLRRCQLSKVNVFLSPPSTASRRYASCNGSDSFQDWKMRIFHPPKREEEVWWSLKIGEEGFSFLLGKEELKRDRSAGAI